MTTGEVLAQQLDGSRFWTNRLIADLAGDDWSFQPAEGMGHALWLCGHLTCAEHLLIHVRCLGGGVLSDEFVSHFPISGPVRPTSAYAYPQVEEVLAEMTRVHELTLEAIRGMRDDLLAEPAFGPGGAVHPHYTDKLGAVSHCARHEAFHAGQLASIRRLLGKPFLR